MIAGTGGKQRKDCKHFRTYSAMLREKDMLLGSARQRIK